MKQIIIHHLSGTRANQTDTLPLDNVQDIILGRDPNADIVFDPDRDDLVSRRHAKIVRVSENPPAFSLFDLKSQNGTFLNQKIVGDSVDLNPGDIIQLGKNGPEISFDWEPRPAASPPPTRMANKDETLAGPTPISTAATKQSSKPEPVPINADKSSPANAAVGRETVERLITQTESQTKSRMITIGSVLGLLLLSAIGWFAYQSQIDKQETETKFKMELAEADRAHKKVLKEIKANRPVSSVEIADRYSDSTVLIEMSWKLVHVNTGQQVYHRHGQTCLAKWVENKCPKPSKILPFYSLESGKLEAYLTISEKSRGITQNVIANRPIGGSGTGSGFVVSSDGFILTNRHVAAPWETRYWSGGQPPLPGILVRCSDTDCKKYTHEILSPRDSSKRQQLVSLGQWVPTKSMAFGGKPASGKTSNGKHLYLDVVFPNTRQRISARLARVSDHADAALVKIDSVRPLLPVELGNETVRPGEEVTILGYPGISPDFQVKVRSEDTFNRESEWKTIPQPTVTGGNIGKVLDGGDLAEDDSITDYFGQYTEAYQLTVNATGAGNSGGPVFDRQARVIGIFTAGRNYGGTAITFAIPIQFGKELMGL